MKAKYRVNDQFRLKKDEIFTRAFPVGGYGKDGSVGEIDKARRAAGSIASIREIYETSVDAAPASYDLDFGDLQVHLSETELLKLFDPI